MIITLKGTTFTKFLDLNSWMIISDLVGVTSSNTATKVTKGDPYTTTFTIDTGCTLTEENVSVVCNGVTKTLTWDKLTEGGKATLSFTPDATVYISIRATGASSGGGEVVDPEIPATYTITYKYVDASGATIKASTTETVTAGTVKNFTTSSAATISGYTVNSVSPQNTTVNSNITVTYTYTADVVIPSGTTVFDLDFTTKTLDDYVSDGVITIPSTSKTDELVYDDKGLTTNKSGTAAQLLNGAKLTNTFDIARDWTFEITMTIDPWQEDFGMTEALYNNFMFVTAPEHEMPLEDGKNHGSNCFTPAIYDNGGTFAGRFPTNGNVNISGASKTITADGIEHTYKWVHTEADQNNACYKDGSKEKDTKWTNTSFTFGGQFGYILGAHSGYSSASNFCLKKGFHIKSMKLYTN